MKGLKREGGGRGAAQWGGLFFGTDHRAPGPAERLTEIVAMCNEARCGCNFYCNDALLPPKYPHACEVAGQPQSGVSSLTDPLWNAYFSDVYENWPACFEPRAANNWRNGL